MRLLHFFSIVLLFQLARANAESDTSRLPRPLTIKSAKIVYQFFNGPQCGVKTIIFDDWGRREKEEVTTVSDTVEMQRILSGIRHDIQQTNPPGGETDSLLQAFSQVRHIQHQLGIHDSGEVYQVDLDRKIGYKRQAFQGVPMNSDLFDQKEVGKDTILGKPCRVVVVQDAFRIWYWGKIALKKELAQKVDGMRVGEYAIEIDENYRIRPDEFKVPASINMQ